MLAAIRSEWRRRRADGIHRSMAFAGDGLVLGAGTVLARGAVGRQAFVPAPCDPEERVAALLSVAYRRLFEPGAIDRVRRASQCWSRGEPCLALIHLALLGLPPLDDDAAWRLYLAERAIDGGVPADELLRAVAGGPASVKAGFDPGEPRLPAGSGQGGGEWTEGDASPVVPAADRRGPTADEYRRGDFNRFFDTLYPPVHALAQRLGIDETWLLGLAAYESYWLGPHDRRLNNPFGTTHGGGPNVGYGSIGAAVAYWEARFGPAVRGAVSAEDFAQRLWQAHYNRKTPNWREQLIAVIRSVPRRTR